MGETGQKTRRITRTFSFDRETVELIDKLRERGYNVSKLIRKLLKEFYEKEIAKSEGSEVRELGQKEGNN
jgi:hypothetical protein